MREISINELKLNPMTLIGGEWWVIAAGNQYDGCNAMTASWGHLGAMWERPEGKAHMGLPTAIVYVRPHRYTKEYLDRESHFSLSIFSSSHKKALGYLGTHSGREGDKIAAAGLKPIFADGMIYFAQAKMVFLCRKLYHAPLQEAGFVDKSLIDNCYPKRDFHEMYIGEIIQVWVGDGAEHDTE